MIIEISPETTPEQAIVMAHAFALSLRKTGWELRDEDYARSLWIEREYAESPVVRFLLAGFTAGYHLESKPTVGDVTTEDVPSKQPEARPASRAAGEKPARS